MSRSPGRGFFARLRTQAALPGVAPISEFEALFLNECARVERNGQSLSLLVYGPTEPSQRAELASVLRLRLRPTDVVGELDATRLAVLLPETAQEGAWSLAEDLLELLAKQRIKARCEVFCHPFTPTPRQQTDSRTPDVRNSGDTPSGPEARPLVLGARTAGPAQPMHAVGARATHARTESWARSADAVRGPALAVAAAEPEAFARAGRTRRGEHAVASRAAVARGATSAARRSAFPARIEDLSTQIDTDPSEIYGQRPIGTLEEAHEPVRAPVSGLRAVRAALGERPVGRLDELFLAPMPWWKRSVDVAVCLVLLPLLAPILLAAALAVRLTSPGPVIFRQQRAGRGGKPFTIYKFRSMYIDAEARRLALEAQNEASGPVFKIRADPRITPVGRFIRKSSIDELPQLWNVLKGDMSLVGPRPPMLSEIENYQRWQKGRLNLTGGITCIWQVSGRSEIGFIDWVRMDLRYARTRGFLTDASLLWRTFGAVFSRRGAY